ncbi:MAG: hypothetical protein ACRDPC_18355, partial [Solirubrobacteraceae bacterium]
VAPPRPGRAGRAGLRWTAGEDELLRLHGALNPAALAELLDRSPEAITQRLRRLGLRDGAERSPHHPAPARGRLTPGQRAAVARELPTGGPGRELALARRLGLPPATIRRVSNPTATMNASDALARARVIGAELGGRRQHPEHHGPAAGT